jgi:hypothetical protein
MYPISDRVLLGLNGTEYPHITTNDYKRHPCLAAFWKPLKLILKKRCPAGAGLVSPRPVPTGKPFK